MVEFARTNAFEVVMFRVMMMMMMMRMMMVMIMLLTDILMLGALTKFLESAACTPSVAGWL